MINIVIPMAGEGSRFKDVGVDTPKPLIEIDGKTLIEHSISTLGIAGRFIFITKK
jgi:choline kinase